MSLEGPNYSVEDTRKGYVGFWHCFMLKSLNRYENKFVTSSKSLKTWVFAAKSSARLYWQPAYTGRFCRSRWCLYKRAPL